MSLTLSARTNSLRNPRNMPQSSHLFRLPLELRQLIYRFVIAGPKYPFLKEFKGHRVSPMSSDLAHQPRPAMGLFGTCTQIRNEALPIFYKETIFWYYDRSFMQKTIVRAMEQGQHINMRHLSLIPFVDYMSDRASMGYLERQRLKFLDLAVDLPQLKTLEIPQEMLPNQSDHAEISSVWLDLMATLRGNGGYLSIVRGRLIGGEYDWRHYWSWSQAVLALASVKIETWEQFVETRISELLEDIFRAARVDNENTPLPRKNIRVQIDGTTYVVRIWGLPDKVFKSKVLMEERNNRLAERRAFRHRQHKFPGLQQDEDDTLAGFSGSRKKKLTREDARNLRKGKNRFGEVSVSV
ncbi:hypothetical protein NA57DRAFT_70162 [Rhizodiscina lignyota]|uniref:Uncharacterized protein n=1 Tax=Rhizodiscina lignyota TaxID=1504668 RepID=A0A9P4IRB7_9PEZI|nr:hypothetical protein NA57DRAFT_70162 [Rhizodiscina lignyota]